MHIHCARPHLTFSWSDQSRQENIPVREVKFLLQEVLDTAIGEARERLRVARNGRYDQYPWDANYAKGGA